MNNVDTSWPTFANLNSEAQRYYDDATLNGNFALNEAETLWRDLYDYFSLSGYALPLRYSPDWVPSWRGTSRNPEYCDDAIMPPRPDFVVCTRIADRKMIGVKHTKNRNEAAIAEYLVSRQGANSRSNHCTPILHVLCHPHASHEWFIFMPLLRPFNDPDFSYLGEVTDFVFQILEGLDYMHCNRVAHRDCAALNIMMDATPLYPEGFHPIRIDLTLNLFEPAQPLFRIDHPVRYYFIDFGMSSHFPTGVMPKVIGDKGRDRDVPELSTDIPYDAYKADVYILGNTLRQEIVEKYQGTSFLRPLVDFMTLRCPSKRATASEARVRFREICATLPTGYEHYRVHHKDESLEDRLTKGSVKLVTNGIDLVGRAIAGS